MTPLGIGSGVEVEPGPALAPGRTSATERVCSGSAVAVGMGEGEVANGADVTIGVDLSSTTVGYVTGVGGNAVGVGTAIVAGTVLVTGGGGVGVAAPALVEREAAEVASMPAKSRRVKYPILSKASVSRKCRNVNQLRNVPENATKLNRPCSSIEAKMLRLI
ncbi:MAG: hypothetical protein ACRDFS_03310 [Chloroflexota bacterium]